MQEKAIVLLALVVLLALGVWWFSGGAAPPAAIVPALQPPAGPGMSDLQKAAAQKIIGGKTGGSAAGPEFPGAPELSRLDRDKGPDLDQLTGDKVALMNRAGDYIRVVGDAVTISAEPTVFRLDPHENTISYYGKQLGIVLNESCGRRKVKDHDFRVCGKLGMLPDGDSNAVVYDPAERRLFAHDDAMVGAFRIHAKYYVQAGGKVLLEREIAAYNPPLYEWTAVQTIPARI